MSKKQQREDMKKAREMYQNKEFGEALKIYDQLWPIDKALFYAEDIYRYCVCLRKSRKSSEALPIARELSSMKPLDTRYKNLLGWILYDRTFHEKSTSGEETTAAAEEILSITRQQPQSPYELTVIKMLEKLTAKVPIPGVEIDRWLNRIDPSLLDTASYDFDLGKGRTVRRPSNAEAWYLSSAILHFFNQNYRDCIATCDTILALIDEKIPNADKAPFLWYRGLSNKKQGNIAEALEEFLEVKKSTSDYSIYYEIANALFSLGDEPRSLKYAVKAVLSSTEISRQYEAYLLLANIYQNTGSLEMERKCLLLYRLVSEEQKNAIAVKVAERIATLSVPVMLTKDQLYRELEMLWVLSCKKIMYRKEGTVKKIFTQKRGTVIDSDGKEYTFGSRAVQGSPTLLKPGNPVSIYIDPEDVSMTKQRAEAYLVIPKP
jgi:tetratricopeptide (TPR) repeat protein